MTKELKRDENGKLQLSHYLDLEIMFGDFFKECKTEDEADWLYREMLTALDLLHEERLDELEEMKEVG